MNEPPLPLSSLRQVDGGTQNEPNRVKVSPPSQPVKQQQQQQQQSASIITHRWPSLYPSLSKALEAACATHAHQPPDDGDGQTVRQARQTCAAGRIMQPTIEPLCPLAHLNSTNRLALLLWQQRQLCMCVCLCCCPLAQVALR